MYQHCAFLLLCLSVCGSKSQARNHGDWTVQRCCISAYPSYPLPLRHCWDGQIRWAPVSSNQSAGESGVCSIGLQVSISTQ